MLHRLTLKQHVWIGSSVLLFGSCLMIGTILYPSIRDLEEISSDIIDIQQELEDEYTETQAMRRTFRELDDVFTEVATYSTMAIRPGRELDMISELEQLAQTHHVTQTPGVVYSETPDQQVGLPFLTFSLVLNGQYSDVMAYLAELEQKPYYANSSHIDLSRSGDATSMKFDARIYVYTST